MVTLTLVVRLRPGLGVGETRRETHLVDVDIEPGTEISAELVARCGSTFGSGQLELLDKPTGMPCVLCLAKQPSNDAEPAVAARVPAPAPPWERAAAHCAFRHSSTDTSVLHRAARSAPPVNPTRQGEVNLP